MEGSAWVSLVGDESGLLSYGIHVPDFTKYIYFFCDFKILVLLDADLFDAETPRIVIKALTK